MTGSVGDMCLQGQWEIGDDGQWEICDDRGGRRYHDKMSWSYFKTG